MKKSIVLSALTFKLLFSLILVAPFFIVLDYNENPSDQKNIIQEKSFNYVASKYEGDILELGPASIGYLSALDFFALIVALLSILLVIFNAYNTAGAVLILGILLLLLNGSVEIVFIGVFLLIVNIRNSIRAENARKIRAETE